MDCAACPSHWKGVCAFGIKLDTLTVTWIRFFTRPLRAAAVPKSATFRAKEIMPSRSRVSSVGNPSIKYNFMADQPAKKAASVAANRSSSVTPLLITSRKRCVPASGAKVKPVLRPFCTSSAKSTEKESTRSEGKDTAIPWAWYACNNKRTNFWISP